jgi:hypothetical protein
MRAQEYKTVFVTDQGSVQQAVAITKMTDLLRRRRKYLRPLFFTAKPGRGSNPAQKNDLQKMNPYHVSHIALTLLQLWLDIQIFLLHHKHIPNSCHGHEWLIIQAIRD